MNAVSLLFLVWPVLGADMEPVREVQGIHHGTMRGMTFVARDRKAWDALQEAVGPPQDLPRTAKPLESLASLNNVDFSKEMIVAIFWGEMTFSGQGEKCWIKDVTTNDKEVVVECQANLWGGPVKRAYRAWPFHVRVVPKSDLPVRFTQVTFWIEAPEKIEKARTLGVIKPDHWRQNLPLPGEKVDPAKPASD